MSGAYLGRRGSERHGGRVGRMVRIHRTAARRRRHGLHVVTRWRGHGAVPLEKCETRELSDHMPQTSSIPWVRRVDDWYAKTTLLVAFSLFSPGVPEGRRRARRPLHCSWSSSYRSISSDSSSRTPRWKPRWKRRQRSSRCSATTGSRSSRFLIQQINTKLMILLSSEQGCEAVTGKLRSQDRIIT